MNVTVKRIGNELAVVLPDDVAAKLNAHDGATLPLTETDTGIAIARAPEREGVRPEIMAAHRESMERFDWLYKKLAE